MAEPVNKDTFLYKFLIDPSYRWVRHLLVFIAVTIISANQTFFAISGEGGSVIGSYIVVYGLYVLLVYLSLGYFNLYVLIPRYLLRRKYLFYSVSLILTTLLILLFQYVGEWSVYRCLGVDPGPYSYLNENRYSLISYISEGVGYILCLLGISMAIILKQWIWEREEVGNLEKIRIRVEVEQLREQVNPLFLFNILHYTGMIAGSQPEKAAEMVMNLSRLLRYQLYDGNRERVLLSGEIQFLINYFKLENLYSGRIRFELNTEGDVNRAFILPLTLLPFGRYSIEEIYQKETDGVIRLHIAVEEKWIRFVLFTSSAEEVITNRFSTLIQRLDLAYGEDYLLDMVRQEKENKIQLILKR